MSMKPYPEYKDSGLEWLGSLPTSWKALRLKFGFELQKRPISSDMEIVTAFRDGEVTLRKNRRADGYTEGDKQIGYQGIEPGDLVIHAMDAFAGAIGVSDSRGKSTPVYNVCKPKRGVQARFFAFALRHLAITGYIESLSKGIRERSTDFRWADAKNVIVPFPPQNEQGQIVEFLDRETAEIDAFIADQEELIELLSERRTATITRAVTKGLDPSAPMKDSGVEWLGTVPKNWIVGPVKRFFTSLDSVRIPLSTEERSYRQGNYPYYGASGVIDRVDDYLFDEPLVLVSEDGANLNLRSNPIAFVASGKYWVNNHAHALRPMNPAVYFWAERIEASNVSPWVTGAAQPKLTAEALMNLVISAPSSFDECLQIQDYIVSETAEIDAAIADAREAITLSKERRVAVISAAVTGKIDVRGLVDPATSIVEGASVGAA